MDEQQAPHEQTEPEPAGDLGHRPPTDDLADVPAENTPAGVIGREVDPATEQSPAE